MSQILDEKPMTEKEKVEKLKENLGKEAASMVEELLKNGLTPNDILDLFLKHGDNLSSLVQDDFFVRELIFPDEPSDAHLHKSRDVFLIIDKEESRKVLPYMSPSGKVHIFGIFFEVVLKLIDQKGLTHREILDLMRSRMGAGYAKEFDELREKGFSLQQIVDYFLRRDEETISESRLVAKLKADARVDSRVYLKRTYSKEKWGVSLTYTFRYSLIGIFINKYQRCHEIHLCNSKDFPLLNKHRKFRIFICFANCTIHALKCCCVCSIVLSDPIICKKQIFVLMDQNTEQAFLCTALSFISTFLNVIKIQINCLAKTMVYTSS